MAVNYLYNTKLPHFGKKFFSFELLRAHSMPGGSGYVLHICYPPGHAAHCLACQRLS